MGVWVQDWGQIYYPFAKCSFEYMNRTLDNVFNKEHTHLVFKKALAHWRSPPALYYNLNVAIPGKNTHK